MKRRDLIEEFRDFAYTLEVSYKGDRRSWASHADPDRNNGKGFIDEETLVQPRVFPSFAERFLGWTVGTDLAPESSDIAGTPDFTPDDRVTHRFVFETKGTAEQNELTGHGTQVINYLSVPSTDVVVLTNMIGVRVLRSDDAGGLVEDYSFSLRGLWTPDDLEIALKLPDAAKFERFVQDFSRRELTTDEKIDRIRSAPPWTGLEPTPPDWLRTRIGRVVEVFQSEVRQLVDDGHLFDAGGVTDEERAAVATEIRGLLVRFGVDIDQAEAEPLANLLGSTDEVWIAAREQYVAHVAYWITTKLVLVRVWEDLGLLTPATLYDGGFDDALMAVGGKIHQVVAGAFLAGERRYRALFVRRQSSYSWYEPSRETAVDGLYELANTFMGNISSDVLGQVYETMLQRIDRKLLGQYYTPRDVIQLMWDLVDLDALHGVADAEDRGTRVLDIATGSGGFLVEGVSRERERFETAAAAGASLTPAKWLERVASGYVGIEFQRFSAFLAELNMLIQLSPVLAANPSLRAPELSILNADTLTLHQPALVDEIPSGGDGSVTKLSGKERTALRARIKDPEAKDNWFDAALGNPPYVGEKGGAAALLSRLEARHPYWDQFRAAHRDYLYGFLIVGISKLRPGGRFAFITTEYWLRATGAAPLRQYIAANCDVERLILFRDLRLFPDAPGQHNLIIVGSRATDDNDDSKKPSGSKPDVSVYEGPNLSMKERAPVLAAMLSASRGSNVRSFQAAESPNSLGASPWIEATLSKAQAKRRKDVLSRPQLAAVKTTEGAIVTAQSVNSTLAKHMTNDELAATPKGTGIYELGPSEIKGLGKLNEAEKAVVRPVINTKDVYPYAVVLPEGHAHWIYLPEPDDSPEGLTDEQVIQQSFDDASMPSIGKHLAKFRSPLTKRLLEGKEDSRYVRPWWTAHQARAEQIGSTSDDADWASFCVTARWGAGGSLVVGMAPPNAVPKSSLHLLYAADVGDDRHAAYLCGIYNSDLFQQITETMPPGHTRGGELEVLGLPDIDEESRESIEKCVLALAKLVSGAMATAGLGDVFPQLRESMRNDVALPDTPTGWVPIPGAANAWGTVDSVAWLEEAGRQGAQAKRVSRAAFENSLFGPVLRLEHEGSTASSHLELAIGGDHQPDKLEEAALLAWADGLAHEGVHLKDVSDQPMPISLRILTDQHDADRAALEAFVDDYRRQRRSIEEELGG